MIIDNDFDGVFKFTNPTTEDYKHLWNNIEYTFPAMSTSPMIIPNETLENIQEIRKRFAYDLAVKRFYGGKEYHRLNKMGNGIPPTFDEKLLQPMIDECLKPLPVVKAIVRKIEKPVVKAKVSKAVGINANLTNEFKDDEEKVFVGEMSTEFKA